MPARKNPRNTPREHPYLRQVVFHPERTPDFSRHPFNIPAVRDIARLDFHPAITFFTGENGAGKSTVLEALALALGYNAEGGSKFAHFQTADTRDDLYAHLRLIRSPPVPKDGYFLRAESFFNVVSNRRQIGYEQDYDGSTLHGNSHGEAFLSVLLHRLSGNGLYLMDEPEAALSPARQMAVLRAFDRLVRQHSQLIIATHSPILLAYPNARIYRFDQSGIREIAYEDSEPYRMTRDFLNHYPHRIAQLLADTDD